jgi:hypothetical protein
MSYYFLVNPNYTMPHTVESTIRLSAADYARGAVDLTPEETVPDLPVSPSNVTFLDTAVSVVREAAPKIIEAITNHLVPAVPQSTGAVQRYPEAVYAPQGQSVSTHPPEIMISPPLETVVVVAVPANHTSSIPISPVDTVCFII